MTPAKSAAVYELRYVAQFLPYGLRKFMNFAGMSEDFRAKKVGSFWLWSDKATQDRMDLEGLCEKCRITPGELVGSRTMLERYSHIRMQAKVSAVAGVSLGPKQSNSDRVPVKVPVATINAAVQ